MSFQAIVVSSEAVFVFRYQHDRIRNDKQQRNEDRCCEPERHQVIEEFSADKRYGHGDVLSESGDMPSHYNTESPVFFYVFFVAREARDKDRG